MCARVKLLHDLLRSLRPRFHNVSLRDFAINLYIRNTELRYLLDNRWSDRRETSHVNRVGHVHENSQGKKNDVDCTLLINVTSENSVTFTLIRG